MRARQIPGYQDWAQENTIEKEQELLEHTSSTPLSYPELGNSFVHISDLQMLVLPLGFLIFLFMILLASIMMFDLHSAYMRPCLFRYVRIFPLCVFLFRYLDCLLIHPCMPVTLSSYLYIYQQDLQISLSIQQAFTQCTEYLTIYSIHRSLLLVTISTFIDQLHTCVQYKSSLYKRSLGILPHRTLPLPNNIVH